MQKTEARGKTAEPTEALLPIINLKKVKVSATADLSIDNGQLTMDNC